MAKQIRYTGSFQSVSGHTIKFDILQEQGSWYSPGYTPVDVLVSGDSPIVIDWPDTKPEDVFHSSTLTLHLISETNFQFLDLHTASYADVRINVYVDDALYWSGSIDDEAYTEPFEPLKNYTVTLTFNDFGQLNRQAAIRKAGVQPGALLYKHLFDLGFPSQMLTDILTGAVDMTSTLVTKVDSVQPDVSLNAFSSLAFDLTTLDREVTAWEAIEAMYKPLNWHIIQKAGHLYVFDINGIIQSATNPPATQWSSDSQTLNINEVYSEINVTFSPYVDLDAFGGSSVDYDGGIFDSDAHEVTAASSLNYVPHMINGATVSSYPYDYTYRGVMTNPWTGVQSGSRIYTPGSISNDSCYKFPADHFDTSLSPIEARLEMPRTGFSVWFSKDVVSGCPITLGTYAWAFKIHNAGSGIEACEGVSALIRSIGCLGDEDMILLKDGGSEFKGVKHINHYKTWNHYGSLPFAMHADARAAQDSDNPPILFSLDPFHIPAGDDSSYLNIKLPLHLSAGPNPSLDHDADTSKYSASFYNVRLVLDSEGTKTLMGVSTPVTSLDFKAIHNGMAEALRFVYVPVRIKFVSDTGVTLYYTNRHVIDRRSDFWDWDDTIGVTPGVWWKSTPSICYMAYYLPELDKRVEGSPLDGADFAINSQAIGTSFGVLGTKLFDNVEGQSIPFPTYGSQEITHLSGSIYIDVLDGCWEIGYSGNGPKGYVRAVDASEFDAGYNEESKFVAKVNTLTTLCLFKQPEISVKVDNQSGSLDDAEAFDIVYTATIDESYVESYDTDVQFGTKTDKTPICRNLLSINDKFGSNVLEFTRNGISGTAEALLCSTLYSQYADRHVELTGNAFSDVDSSHTAEDFSDRMVKSNPHLPGSKLLLESCYEDLALDTCDAVYRETQVDTYTPINVDTE